MPFQIDQPHEITSGVIYTSVAQHRRYVNLDKSRWTISIEEEIQCFRFSLVRKWIKNNRGWGFRLLENNTIVPLGVSCTGEELKMAKFVDSNNTNSWHGYPADYRKKAQDRPPFEILSSWSDEGIIDKHQVSKIRSGKVCNL